MNPGSTPGNDVISFSANVQTDSWVSPTIYATGTGDPSPELQRLERETERSTPYSAEVKNEWRYTAALAYVLRRGT
jgi:hypothetical protein